MPDGDGDGEDRSGQEPLDRYPPTRPDRRDHGPPPPPRGAAPPARTPSAPVPTDTRSHGTGPEEVAAAATPHYGADVDLFSRSWTALLTAVAEIPDRDFARPSGCAGWLVRDLVCHLVIDAQDVLITLATPAATEPTVDAVTYWHVQDHPPTGEDPLDASPSGWPPRTGTRTCSASTSTTSAPPPAARPDSPTRTPGWAPATRSSPWPTTSARTSWSGRCTTSTSSPTSPTRGPGRPRRAWPAPAPCWRRSPEPRSPPRSPTGTHS
ncbi:maleylpyruvate isomerase N-terminal domain-containing protein [Streptomyces virginiae]|uniref:maleylpyruvate isomerase N-terminal domain-containing protein n=1 Tax=Streptomyces virginiae TaxID=1961 RepID=UPI00367A4CC9